MERGRWDSDTGHGMTSCQGMTGGVFGEFGRSKPIQNSAWSPSSQLRPISLGDRVAWPLGWKQSSANISEHPLCGGGNVPQIGKFYKISLTGGFLLARMVSSELHWFCVCLIVCPGLFR